MSPGIVLLLHIATPLQSFGWVLHHIFMGLQNHWWRRRPKLFVRFFGTNGFQLFRRRTSSGRIQGFQICEFFFRNFWAFLTTFSEGFFPLLKRFQKVGLGSFDFDLTFFSQTFGGHLWLIYSRLGRLNQITIQLNFRQILKFNLDFWNQNYVFKSSKHTW